MKSRTALSALVALLGAPFVCAATQPAPAISSEIQSAKPEPVLPEFPSPAMARLPDPFTRMANILGILPREQSAKAAPMLADMNRSIDAELAQWKANGGSNPIGEEKLAMARADLEDKVGSLSFADDYTWENARAEVMTSLSNLKRTYDEVLTKAPTS